MQSNRRTFLKTVGAGTAGLTLAGAGDALLSDSAQAQRVSAGSDGPVLEVGERIAVAETTSGKVRGYILRGIHYFLGMPYGADTSGANRFMPPQKPKPWTDVYPALWWGNSAPQDMDDRYANAYASFRDHWNYGDVDEDCLRLNVFTPALKGGKRPVLFWIHGGGFTNGNGIEQDGYNGENLARFGDLVFCSINHRLGPLGYCNLAGVGGDRFKASGNVGMLDIVAALEWVRDNIANFGGDPDNVTIVGQSGGGAKVCILTAMPAAKGLFHKAVVLSGAALRAGEKADAEMLGGYVLREAGLAPKDAGKLQDLPWKSYYALATKAQQNFAQAAGRRVGFSPSVDGDVLPQHPYFPSPAATAADVAMIINSNMNELPPAWPDASLANMTLAEAAERLEQRTGFGGPGLGDKARAVVAAYAKLFPDKSPAEIWSLVASNRGSVVALADAKAKQAAPVFVSWFAWQPPLFDGRLGAFHCLDICFWFDNTDIMFTHTGGGARPRRLARKMAASLVQFMRTGDPNGNGLTEWPRYTSARGETLVLDDVCRAEDDPDRKARALLTSA